MNRKIATIVVLTTAMGLALSRPPRRLKNSDHKTSRYGRTDQNHFSARPKPPFDNHSFEIFYYGGATPPQHVLT
ncbi:unnamed protein product [Ectocarpus sp. CCAP 1310/34]|nr:unnamed protein product [Ectocarpus sp. CCAP 1310/34]